MNINFYKFQFHLNAFRIICPRHVLDELEFYKQQVQNRDDEIFDLKLCVQRNEIELKKFRQTKTYVKTSSIPSNAEIQKALPMLTTNQISLMTKTKKRVNWTAEEISKGFALSFMGKRGYNFTIHELGLPMPSLRTLYEWGERITLKPGVLEDCFIVLSAMKAQLTIEQSQVRWF